MRYKEGVLRYIEDKPDPRNGLDGLVAEFETGRFATWLQALNWCARAAEAFRSLSAKLAAVERERDAFATFHGDRTDLIVRATAAEARVKALTERLAEMEAGQ